MTTTDRIKQLIEKKGVTSYEVCAKTGISQATMSRILNNNTAKLRESTLEILAKYFGVEADWLRTGTGKRENAENLASDISDAEIIQRLTKQNAQLITALERHTAIIENLSDTIKKLNNQ